MHDLAEDLAPLDRPHDEMDAPVGQEDLVSLPGVARQVRVVHRHAPRRGIALARDEPHLVPLREAQRLRPDVAHADLRPAEILHDRHAVAHAPYDLVNGAVLLVCAVGEVEPRHVHPRLDETADRLLVARGRPDRADDLRPSHRPFSSRSGRRLPGGRVA